MNYGPLQISYDEAPYYYHPEKITNRERSGKSVLHAVNRDPGAKSLCVAIVEQAVLDYFRLVRAGLIRFGRLAGTKWEKYRVSVGRRFRRSTICDMTRQEAESLILFLQELNQFADAIELDRNWSDCWQNILRLERTGNYRKYMMKYDNRIEVADDCD
jgi:hypothetical protein